MRVEDVLAELHLQLVSFALLYTPAGHDWEDTAQEGRIGVLIAYRRWDPARDRPGVSPVEWCRSRMFGAMRDHIRRIIGRAEHKSRPPTFVSLDTVLPSGDVVDDPIEEPGFAVTEANLILDAIAADLRGDVQREVLALMRAGLSQAEVTAARGVTYSSTCRQLALLRHHAAKHLENS